MYMCTYYTYIYICPSPRTSLDPLKLIVSIILVPFWVYWALWLMLNISVTNSHFAKRPAAREITTFGCHVGTNVSESVNSY